MSDRERRKTSPSAAVQKNKSTTPPVFVQIQLRKQQQELQRRNPPSFSSRDKIDPRDGGLVNSARHRIPAAPPATALPRVKLSRRDVKQDGDIKTEYPKERVTEGTESDDFSSTTKLLTAQELFQRVSQLESMLEPSYGDDAHTEFRTVCVQLIIHYPEVAKKTGIDKRLWMNWYREIDSLQRSLRKSEQSPIPREQKSGAIIGTNCNHGTIDDITSALCTTLASSTQFYTELSMKLTEMLRQLGNDSSARQRAVCFSIHMTLIALGDLARYEQTRTFRKERDWSIAERYYRRALQYEPTNGKVYNQLALLAMYKQQSLESLYLYVRSLACETPFASQENLLHALQRGKATKAHRLLQFALPTDIIDTFRALVISCQHMLFTGSDMHQWKAELTLTVQVLHQLLNIQDVLFCESAKTLASRIETTLTQVICVVIFLIHNSQNTMNEQKLTREQFDQEQPKWKDNENTKKALNLGFTILICSMKRCIIALSPSTPPPVMKDVLQMLLPSIIIFADWLRVHSWFLNMADPTMKEFRKCCFTLMCTLSSSLLADSWLSKQTNQNKCDRLPTLPEDDELVGFLPCDKASVSVATRSYLPEQDSSRNSLHGDKLLNTRVSRFLRACMEFALLRNDGVPQESVFDRHMTTVPKFRSLSDLNDNFGASTKERICLLCCNTSEFVGGVCEFCGADDTSEYSSHTHDDNNESYLSNLVTTQATISQPIGSNNMSSEYSRALNGILKSSSSSIVSVNPETHSPQLPPSDFASIMAIGTQHTEFRVGLQQDQSQKCLIVIDAPNVAMRHGLNKKFSCLGIRLVLDYFARLGHRVVAFAPDYLLKYDDVASRRRLIDAGKDVSPAKIPDDVHLLQQMVDEGLLIPTPPQDYDDSYCIQYAGMNDGCVVTNDLFRDHLENMAGPRERKAALRTWLSEHRISYTWVGNEFLPNPNFRFPVRANS